MRTLYVTKNANMYTCRMLFSQASDMAGWLWLSCHTPELIII